MDQELLTFDNPVMLSFAFYATIVLLKMIAMSFMTSVVRMKKKASLSTCNISDINSLLYDLKNHHYIVAYNSFVFMFLQHM